MVSINLSPRGAALGALVPLFLALACGGERPTFGSANQNAAGVPSEPSASQETTGPFKGLVNPLGSQVEFPTIPTGSDGIQPVGAASNTSSAPEVPGAAPGAAPEKAPPGCGDGAVEAPEQCDSGVLNSDDVRGACSTRCSINACSKGETRSCAHGVALGNCTLGTQRCEAGQWAACDIAPAAADGCEPGDDASCNGTANEGCGCSVGQVVACSGIGAKGECAKGQAICGASGEYGPCSIQPKVSDACDVPGDDSNCNGIPNEGCDCSDGETQPCGVESDEGECEFGQSVCVGGKWGECQGAVLPRPRDCSSTQDNDCDGKPDNTIDDVCACQPGASQACDEHPGSDGKGDCKAGTRACVVSADKASSRWAEACTGAVGPQTSDSCTKPGDDSNCDGKENGGCECLSGQTTTCGERWGYEGACSEYALTCSNAGAWPQENTACKVKGNESCAAPGECIIGVWDDDAVVWDEACWD